MTWNALLKDFQNVLVGIIGFTGVIITIAVNAYISRRERNKERNHERQAIRAALITELSIVKDSLERFEEELRSRDTSEAGDVLVPTDNMDDAYRALLPKIGLLTLDGHCQTKATLFQKSHEPAVSGRKLTPLGKRGGAVEFEGPAVIKMTFLVEVIVKRRMDRGEFL